MSQSNSEPHIHWLGDVIAHLKPEHCDKSLFLKKTFYNSWQMAIFSKLDKSPLIYMNEPHSDIINIWDRSSGLDVGVWQVSLCLCFENSIKNI